MLLIPILLQGQVEVVEMNNSQFKRDSYWRGADGGATVELEGDRILWLFSDTFIDQDGTGDRSNARHMIRNSIAIQTGRHMDSALKFHYKGTSQEPKAFFEVPGTNWFWTGHGILIEDKLVVFLIEETPTSQGIGFEAIGWYVAIIDNPSDNPEVWNIKYIKAPDTFGVIVGAPAVLAEENHVYAFGVKEPSTHEIYLLRFRKEQLAEGDLSGLEWWVDGAWTSEVDQEPVSSSLFTGSTEFSVHYDETLEKYVQFQTFGYGKASIGYRLSGKLEGPWSKPKIVYTPTLEHPKEFVYTANAHPELTRHEGLMITYNVNNGDFKELRSNENVYFPRVIHVKMPK